MYKRGNNRRRIRRQHWCVWPARTRVKAFCLTHHNYLKKNFDDIGNCIGKTIHRIDDLRNKQRYIRGSTGFPADKVTYGWQPTDLIILAARPLLLVKQLCLKSKSSQCCTAFNKPTGASFVAWKCQQVSLYNVLFSAESGIMLEKISRGLVILPGETQKQPYSKRRNET